MPFKKQDQVTRNPHLRNIEIRLYRTIDEDNPEYPQGIEFRLTIDDQFDSPMGHRHEFSDCNTYPVTASGILRYPLMSLTT